jgi:hypothetical protein
MCRKPERGGRQLAVDHDHACCATRMRSCGRCVRGLLCSECNRVLGFFEDVARVAAVNAYLGR